MLLRKNIELQIHRRKLGKISVSIISSLLFASFDSPPLSHSHSIHNVLAKNAAYFRQASKVNRSSINGRPHFSCCYFLSSVLEARFCSVFNSGCLS